MPIVARELGSSEVASISTRGTHAVGGVTGLCLQVTSTGARSWLLRITTAHRRREFGLGAFPTVTLEQAREKARSLRHRIGGGADPSVQRRALRAARRLSKVKTATFKACAEAFVNAELSKGREARYLAIVIRDLERLAFPRIGASPVASMTVKEILGVLEPIWTVKPSVATKLRGNIERVLDYASSQGLRDGLNPARWGGNLDAKLPRLALVQPSEHHASLPPDLIPSFFAALVTMPGIASQALQFLILTASRPKDVREMAWSEVSLEDATWSPPASRSANTPLRVPLGAQALRLLRSVPVIGPKSPVFATPRTGQLLSDMSLTAVLRRMNAQRRNRGDSAWVDPSQGSREIVPNGFRESFRSWAMKSPDHLKASGHFLSGATDTSNDGNSESAKQLLEAWTRHCTSGLP